MDEVTNVFVTDEGTYGFSMDSPQVPGLVMGRQTQTEFIADYQQILRDAGVVGRVVGHNQIRGETPAGSEFVIRRMSGEAEADRLVVANQVLRLLKSAESDELLRDLQPSPTGDFVFVACLATDTLGWLVHQLNPRGDVISAVVGVAGVMIASTQIASGDGVVDWPSLAEHGWTMNMTMQELLIEKPADRPLLLHA